MAGDAERRSGVRGASPTTMNSALPLTTEDYFRGVILYGRNVATYKFALGRSLLALAAQGKTFVHLDDLAMPFVDALLDHLRRENRQSTGPTSAFLDTCRRHLAGQVSRDELIQATAKLGFVNVIDAFHIIGSTPVPVRFYDDDRRGRGGIVLTDQLLALPVERAVQHGNLTHEVEARWRLVETAWSLNLPPRQLQVRIEESTGDLFVVDASRRRKAVTQARHALDGYQRGRCFYCGQEADRLTEIMRKRPRQGTLSVCEDRKCHRGRLTTLPSHPASSPGCPVERRSQRPYPRLDDHGHAALKAQHTLFLAPSRSLPRSVRAEQRTPLSALVAQ